MQPLLAANIGEVLGAILALLLPVLWVIKQIADAAKPGPVEAAPAAARPPRPQPQPAVQQAGGQADPLRQQVEEFLRRAGRGPAAPRGDHGREPQGRPQPVSEIELLLDDEPSRPERQPLAEPLRPNESRAAAAGEPAPAPQPTPEKSGSPRQPRRSVTPRPRKTLAERATERAAARTQSQTQQVSHLGQRIIADDKQFDIKLKARFAHSIGSLADSSVSVPEQPPPSDTAAGQIAAMLASPEGVRQAVILNEILRRPSDRW